MFAKYICKPLGVDMTPIGISKCQLEALGVVGQFLGMMNDEQINNRNVRLQEQTNELNAQLAREANEMSQAQFNENMKWLREQYYDTDKVRRNVEALQKAHLNPALALGNVQNASNVGAPSHSQFHVAHMEAPHEEPMRFGDGLSESIGHAVDAFFANQQRNALVENTQADTQIKRADAMTRFAENIAKIRQIYIANEKMLADKQVSEETRKKLMLENEQIDNNIKLFWTQFEALSEQPKKANRLLDRQADDLQADTALKRIEYQFRPALLSAGLKLSESQSSAALGAAAASWEEAKTKYHYRHEIMPLDSIEKSLTNGILVNVFNEKVSYERFIKDNQFSDWRNFIKTFGEFLFRLQPK